MELSLMTFSMMRNRFQHKMDAETLCRIAEENGLQSMDFMDCEVELYGEAELTAAMLTHGIRCGCLITNVPIFLEPQKANVGKALELAARMGSRYLMVIPGNILPEERAFCEKAGRQKLLDMAVNGLARAVEEAKKYGITIGLENTPQDFKPLAAPEDVQYVLEHVPGLGLIFDTGNFRVADTMCDELAIYERLKKYIVRIHLKDVVVGDFPEGERCVDGQRIVPVVTGSGIIPMEELICAFQRDHSDKALAIEYAMPEGVCGEENGRAVEPYCRYIRNVLKGKMQRPDYQSIAEVGKPVSRIFYGTAVPPMLMGKNVNWLLDSMVSLGVNAFDCARGYGKAEESLGAWMRERNNRDRVVILTKCGNVGENGRVCVNRQVIERELQQSLKALQTDYIDIYLLHRDDPNTPVEELIECLNEAWNAGKIRVFGASNWTHERIMEANAYAASKGLQGFSVSSPNYGLAEQVGDPWGGDCVSISGSSGRKAREWYTDNQMPVIAYSSLGRGFFSGRFKAGDMEGARKVLDGPAQKGYLSTDNMERLRRAETLAQRDGMTVAQIAMRYSFSNEMNLFAVVSTLNPQRMECSIKASRMPFEAQDAKYLNLEK